jgi:hypothetical protein
VFFIDDKGQKFWVEDGASTHLKQAESPAHGKVVNKHYRKYYYKEGDRFFYVDTRGEKVYVSKAEYGSAAAKGKAYSYVNTGAKFYYAGLDGRYFYIDESSGRKKYVDRAVYEKFL